MTTHNRRIPHEVSAHLRKSISDSRRAETCGAGGDVEWHYSRPAAFEARPPPNRLHTYSRTHTHTQAQRGQRTPRCVPNQILTKRHLQHLPTRTHSIWPDKTTSQRADQPNFSPTKPLPPTYPRAPSANDGWEGPETNSKAEALSPPARVAWLPRFCSHTPKAEWSRLPKKHECAR